MPHTDALPGSDRHALPIEALTHTANAVFITDDIGQIVWANDAFQRMSGYLPDEVLGRTPAILQSGEQDHAFYSQLWQSILGGKAWKGEVVEQKKNGEFYTVEEIITPLFNEQGVITQFLAVQHEIPRGKKVSEQEGDLTHRDALTGLCDRTRFLEYLEQAISNAKRTSHILATLVLDLDNFKPLNESIGQAAGDRLLAAIAKRMQTAVRETDIVARFESERFALFLPNLPNRQAAALATKLLERLARPFALRGQQINVTARIGIAVYPDDGENGDLLLLSADKAMYQARCHGGNNYRFLSEEKSPTP